MWLRRYIRSRMAPIPTDKAQEWRRKFSIVYMLMGWNLAAITFYVIFKKEFPSATHEDPSKKYAEIAGVSNATVIKYSGFKKVKQYEIRNENETKDTLGLGITT